MDCNEKEPLPSSPEPGKTQMDKLSARVSDPNMTNFDIEQSNDLAHAQMFAVMDDSKLHIQARDISAHDNSNEEEMKCPQTLPLKSKKALDTMAGETVDYDNLATIPETSEKNVNPMRHEPIKDQEEEKVQQYSFKAQEISDNFKLDPLPISVDPTHQARPQSKPMIADTNNIAMNNQDVPDIDHFDPDISGNNSEERMGEFNSPPRQQSFQDRRSMSLAPIMMSPAVVARINQIGDIGPPHSNRVEQEPGLAFESNVEHVQQMNNEALNDLQNQQRNIQQSLDLAKKEKAITWNQKRQTILKSFQTIFGISTLLTILFVQGLILFSEQHQSSRMIVQSVVILLECLLLYQIIIGISNIHFERTHVTSLLFLTTFNDNNKELEKKIELNVQNNGPTQQTLNLIFEMQKNVIVKQKRLRKIFGLAIVLYVFILILQYMRKLMFGSWPLDSSLIKEKEAYGLNILISALLAPLVIPYIFQLICQVIVKFFLWPLDLKNFNGKWTYNLAYPDKAKANLDQQMQNVHSPRSSELVEQIFSNRDNLGLNPFQISSMAQLEIRINQVAASQVELNIQSRSNGEHAENSPALQQQRLMSIGKEVWQEVKQRVVEYNYEIGKDCSNCSICLIDFNPRQKDENIPGDNVIQLNCNKQHVFHAKCLQDWVDLQFTCPICREILIANQDEAKIKYLTSIIKRNTIITLQNEEIADIMEHDEENQGSR